MYVSAETSAHVAECSRDLISRSARFLSAGRSAVRGLENDVLTHMLVKSGMYLNYSAARYRGKYVRKRTQDFDLRAAARITAGRPGSYSTQGPI
jgi:hypothetical protein